MSDPRWEDNHLNGAEVPIVEEQTTGGGLTSRQVGDDGQQFVVETVSERTTLPVVEGEPYAKKQNKTGLLGFCFGVVSFLFNPFAALSIAAIVLGMVCLKNFDSKVDKHYWMPLAAIIIGVVNTFIYVVSVILGIVGSVLLSPLIRVLVEELFLVIQNSIV